jgi:hypothetical protein
MNKSKGSIAISEVKIKRAVDRNLQKYKETYKLLEQYDRSPETTPTFLSRFKLLQKSLQLLSS